MSGYDPNCYKCNPTHENYLRYRKKQAGGRIGAYSGAAKGAAIGTAIGGPIGGLIGLVAGGLFGGNQGYENPEGAVLGLFNMASNSCGCDS